jgi:large subunit ribosomal protein L4
MAAEPAAVTRIPVIGANGREGKVKLELPQSWFDCEINQYLLKRAVADHQINAAEGNRSTLLRSEVRGGGRKPWRQKGTGRARHGSIRSPIWRGGGIAFAPKPLKKSRQLSRRERRSAFVQALALKARAGSIRGADPMDLGDGKTRTRADWLREAGLSGRGRVLLVDCEPQPSLLRSSANIPHVEVARADTLSTYEVLVADTLVVSADAVATLAGRSG